MKLATSRPTPGNPSIRLVWQHINRMAKCCLYSWRESYAQPAHNNTSDAVHQRLSSLLCHAYHAMRSCMCFAQHITITIMLPIQAQHNTSREKSLHTNYKGLSTSPRPACTTSAVHLTTMPAPCTQGTICCRHASTVAALSKHTSTGHQCSCNLASTCKHRYYLKAASSTTRCVCPRHMKIA